MLPMAYDTLATDDAIARTVAALAERGIEAEVVASGADALARIKGLIPVGASVMNGSSRTLEQIGYIEHLKGGQHGWDNLHAGILAETDKAKQAELRKRSVLSDFYLGSVHALTETGVAVIASNSGSQLPHVVYTSPNLIFVVSTKKIVATLDDAMRRLEEHVIPLEDARLMAAYNAHTAPSKVLIFNREPSFSGRKVRMLLVHEDLGF